MAITNGINHLGLTVLDLKGSTRFFVEYLGWTESGYEPSYPRTAVTDGKVRLTLWEVDKNMTVNNFDRKKNVGLHHLALQVASEAELISLCEHLKSKNDVKIEFLPELIGKGPRKHFMIHDPSGLRIEFIWPGS